MNRRMRRELISPLVVVAVLVIVPELPSTASAVGFDRLLRIPLALALGAAVIAARLGHGRPLTLILGSALRVAFLIATGKPGTLLWAMTLLELWARARDQRAGRWEAALSLLEPLSVLIGFLLWGRAGQNLTIPSVMTVIGPTMHVLLSRQARRIHAAEEEAARLRMVAMRAEADRQRALVLTEVHARLGEELRLIAAAAESAEQALEVGAMADLSRLPTQVREAALELRAAIWAFDPSEESWEAVEARLRRIVGELGGPSLTTDVPQDRRVPPAERVALLRSLRTVLSARPGAPIRVELRGEALFVDGIRSNA